MKNLIAGIVALSLFAIPASSVAQQQGGVSIPYVGKSTKFALMVSDVDHFQGAIRVAEELNLRKNHFSFEIVMIGPLVKSIAEDSSLLPQITKASELGIRLVMCEHAMAHYGVRKEQLDKRIVTTPNGTIYMFELKDRGFNTLVR